MDHLYPPNSFQIVDNVFSYHYLRFVSLIFNPFLGVYSCFWLMITYDCMFFAITIDILLIF